MDGREIMEALGVGPSPLVGRALQYLHEQIAKSPELNRPDPLRTLLARWSERVGDNDSDPSGDATR
jgi:hypothetical protein